MGIINESFTKQLNDSNRDNHRDSIRKVVIELKTEDDQTETLTLSTVLVKKETLLTSVVTSPTGVPHDRKVDRVRRRSEV